MTILVLNSLLKLVHVFNHWGQQDGWMQWILQYLWCTHRGSMGTSMKTSFALYLYIKQMWVVWWSVTQISVPIPCHNRSPLTELCPPCMNYQTPRPLALIVHLRHFSSLSSVQSWGISIRRWGSTFWTALTRRNSPHSAYRQSSKSDSTTLALGRNRKGEHLKRQPPFCW